MKKPIIATFTEGLRRGGETLFLRRYRGVRIAIIVIGAVVSATVAAWILFGTSHPTGVSNHTVQLNTDTIDDLELLIEERQTEYENPPSVPKRVFGL